MNWAHGIGQEVIGRGQLSTVNLTNTRQKHSKEKKLEEWKGERMDLDENKNPV